MRKEQYLTSPTVRGFITWIETFLDTPQSYIHEFNQARPKKQYVSSNLYSDYEQYDWSISGEITEFSELLKKSVEDSNERDCERICYEILKWGGVSRGNKERISRLSPDLCGYLRFIRDRLGRNLASNEYYIREIQMTAGFSKIYSAYIDDFIIYDSRVGAAIGLFARQFCLDMNSPVVPEELLFAWNSGKGENTSNGASKRDPSKYGYDFPQWRTDPKKHLENNIRANWLLSTLSKKTKSRFSSIEESKRLRAIEKALFMIGYDVSDVRFD